MDKNKILKNLEQIRENCFRCWQDYQAKLLIEPHHAWVDMRDIFEMHVRAMDYAIEVIRNDAV